MKILRILTKIILGIFLFYLIAGFMIIPLVLTWVIPSQGTKFLKTPVHVRSVGLNPFLMQVTMDGLEILDKQNQPMISFDKLFLDVSFIDLLKKTYHIEAFKLDGLKVNIELLPGNRINLLALIPQDLLQSNASAAQAKARTSKDVAKTPAKMVKLPVVIIDKIELHQGSIHLTDKTVKPNFVTTLSEMELTVTNVTTDPTAQAKIDFHANLDDKGKISMHTIVIPLAQPLEMESSFSLNDYALGVLTPYAGKYTGRELKNGKLDLNMEYRISDNKLVASHKVLIQRFEFGNNVESKDALHLPFGLAVGLLEDSEGKIKIALPVSGDMNSPKFEYTHLIFQVIRNFFINLVTKPFSFLATSLGGSDTGTDELGNVKFAPGKADLAASQRQKLITLIKGLKQHPKLRLEIDGSYDPQADWKKIQADSFTKDYKALRKISDRSEGKDYQLLYQRRFGIRALWNLAKKYKGGVGNYNDTKLDQEIKRQLIESAPPDLVALGVLAEERAKIVYDFFITSGFNAKRLSIGHPQSTQSSMGYVPLEFTLTVFDKN